MDRTSLLDCSSTVLFLAKYVNPTHGTWVFSCACVCVCVFVCVCVCGVVLLEVAAQAGED